MTRLDELRAFLAQLSPGPIDHSKIGYVEELLAASWEELAADNTDMVGSKVLGRTESLTWTPPVLTFRIERHGATVMGSVYAHVQTWRINLEEGTATCDYPKRRLVGARDRGLKVEPIAKQIAELILTRKKDLRLKWLGPTSVRVETSRVVPTTNRETTTKRRRRLMNALEKELAVHGWSRVPGRLDTFEFTK